MPITSLTSYFNTSSFGDTNAFTQNQKELAFTLQTAAEELSHWKGLVTMSFAGSGFEVGRLVTSTLLAPLAPYALPLFTQTLTWLGGVVFDTGFSSLANYVLEEGAENENFLDRMMSQSSSRALCVVGMGQSFAVMQLLQSLASVSQGMLGQENAQKGQAGTLHSLVQGFRCYFGSGMFAGLTGGAVSSAEARMSLKTKNMVVGTPSAGSLRVVPTNRTNQNRALLPSRMQHATPQGIFLASDNNGGGKKPPPRAGSSTSGRHPKPEISGRGARPLTGGKGLGEEPTETVVPQDLIESTPSGRFRQPEVSSGRYRKPVLTKDASTLPKVPSLSLKNDPVSYREIKWFKAVTDLLSLQAARKAEGYFELARGCKTLPYARLARLALPAYKRAATLWMKTGQYHLAGMAYYKAAQSADPLLERAHPSLLHLSDLEVMQWYQKAAHAFDKGSQLDCAFIAWVRAFKYAERGGNYAAKIEGLENASHCLRDMGLHDWHQMIGNVLADLRDRTTSTELASAALQLAMKKQGSEPPFDREFRHLTPEAQARWYEEGPFNELANQFKVLRTEPAGPLLERNIEAALFFLIHENITPYTFKAESLDHFHNLLGPSPLLPADLLLGTARFFSKWSRNSIQVATCYGDAAHAAHREARERGRAANDPRLIEEIREIFREAYRIAGDNTDAKIYLGRAKDLLSRDSGYFTL